MDIPTMDDEDVITSNGKAAAFLLKISDYFDQLVLLIDNVARIVRRSRSTTVGLQDRLIVVSSIIVLTVLFYYQLRRSLLGYFSMKKSSVDEVDNTTKALIVRPAGIPSSKKRNTVLYYKNKFFQSLYSSRKKCVSNLKRVFSAEDDDDGGNDDKRNAATRRGSGRHLKQQKSRQTARSVDLRQTIPQYLLNYETDTSETSSINTARGTENVSRRSDSLCPDVQYVLKNVKLFANFDRKSVERVLNECIDTRQVPNGSHLFKASTNDENIYVVRSGILQLRVVEVS
ncbi:hypothetical protein ACOME3_005803 [Neoechinorhynchus agilis]